MPVVDCLWCERDCARCGFPVDGGWEHIPIAQESPLIMCRVARVVRPLVVALTGYFDHKRHEAAA